MKAHRIVIYGNSGSGKSTMARALSQELGVPHLDLDGIAWRDRTAVRLPLPESVELLRRYTAAHPAWIIEGCYADLIEAVLPLCTELRFLNPGVEVCVARCRRRRWEPEKYASGEEQDRMLAHLLDWVKQYPTREDEFGLARHRALFDGFAGDKREYGAT
jgi:adenylate kinase family enzyme